MKIYRKCYFFCIGFTLILQIQNSSLFFLLVATEECGKVLITPIKRQIDESWKDLSTNELVDLNGKWDVGQPNGQELQECAFFNLNTGNFYDDTCSTKVCFVCAWSYKPKFLLNWIYTYFAGSKFIFFFSYL